jgi:shikimate dehydrogenase
MLTGSAKLAGVIGWPVAHSRSPLLHGLWLSRYGIDGAYVPLAVPPDLLEVAVRGLAAAGFRGANVTVPHKEAVMALCDILDDSARQAGAVNTLIFADGRIEGRNTDGAGFIANLRAHGFVPAGHALVLGAGGAARAIVAALIATGMRVTIANRGVERAQHLAALFPGVTALPWEARETALDSADLLVNTTTLGMKGDVTPPLSLARAGPKLTVADIVYVPRMTPLLDAAVLRGLLIIPGLGMLLHQAVPGFAAWFGVTPVVDGEIFAQLGADIPVHFRDVP